MVEVIKLVMARGPSSGYNLNMKKCIYLMAPTHSSLSDDEMRSRISVLVSLGIPFENIKIYPDYQLHASSRLVLSDAKIVSHKQFTVNASRTESIRNIPSDTQKTIKY